MCIIFVKFIFHSKTFYSDYVLKTELNFYSIFVYFKVGFLYWHPVARHILDKLYIEFHFRVNVCFACMINVCPPRYMGNVTVCL